MKRLFWALCLVPMLLFGQSTTNYPALKYDPATGGFVPSTTNGHTIGSGGSGTYLSNHAARVEPTGNDSTGTIGDLAKPFLTVQAALTAFENDPNGNGNGTYPDHSIALILVGNNGDNTFNEDLTTSLRYVSFKGDSANRSYAYNSLTFTAPSGTGAIELGLYSIESPGPVIASTTDQVFVILENVEGQDFKNLGGPISMQCDTGTSQARNITASGQIDVYGFNKLGTLSAPGFIITITSCHQLKTGLGAPTIDSAGSNVWVQDSIIDHVTAAGTLLLVDSRVRGVNNATTTTYADVSLGGPHFGDGAGLTNLVGDDTAYDATTWNGNTGVPTKNAVRDKFETLAGGGTVTSFSAGDLSPLFTTSEATITTTPALTFTLSTHTANTVFAGPTTGSAAAPTFRALVSGDIPDLSATYQPADSDLTTWAGITPGTGVGTALAVNVGSSGAFVTNGGALGTPSSGNGSNLTALNGSQVTTGMIAPARLGTGSGGSTKFLREDSTFQTIGGGDALVANPLSQFASTTSAQLRGVLSDELGTGVALFDGATPTSFVLTNATGSPTGISLTLAQLNTIVSDDDVAGLAAANTFTGANINSKSGAASVSAMKYSGVPFAGTGTTSFPLVYVNDANATASTTLNTAGTYFGVNGDGSQDLMNLLKDGTSVFKVTSAGAVTASSTITTTSTVDGLNVDVNGGKVRLASDGVTGDLVLKNSGSNAFSLLIFGLASTSGSAIATSGVNSITLQSGAGSATWNDATTANSGTVANRYLFGIAAPTLTSTGTSVTNTVASTVYIGGAPTDSTNTTSTTKWALNVAAGNTNLGGSVTIGGGTAITKVLSATATLDFGSTAAGAVSDLTITVTGAALGDVVSLGIPNASVPASGTFTAWVSSTNTVTVRYENNDLITARDPASGTFRAMVTQF